MCPELTEAVIMSDIKNLRPCQEEFALLAELAGVSADPRVYKILIALLNNDTPPNIIYKLLKTIRKTSTMVNHN